MKRLFLVLLFLLSSVVVSCQNTERVNCRDDLGRTPLHKAESKDEVKSLIKAGADVNDKDILGRTPLYWVNDIQVIKALIKAGADVNARDIYGRTPLHRWACCKKAVEILLESGADVNAKFCIPLRFLSVGRRDVMFHFETQMDDRPMPAKWYERYFINVTPLDIVATFSRDCKASERESLISYLKSKGAKTAYELSMLGRAKSFFKRASKKVGSYSQPSLVLVTANS